MPYGDGLVQNWSGSGLRNAGEKFVREGAADRFR